MQWQMTFSRAKKHYEALLEAAEYYRLKMLQAKKKSRANEIRANRQHLVAWRAMNDALDHGHV